MINPRASLLTAALLAAGCDRAPAPSPAATASTSAADAALLAKIEALPPGQRDIVLFRAIRDARQDCQGIAATARLDPVDGHPAWSAQCDNRARFLITLQPGGMFSVTPGTAIRQPSG